MQQISVGDLGWVGAGLRRPECVLTTRSGDIFVSDQRGGVSVIGPDGSVRFIAAAGAPEGFLPNGIALCHDRSLLVANLGPTGGVWRLARDGRLTPFLLEVDGRPLPPTNFVGLDRRGRVWVTVSTRQFPREKAFRKGWADGFIVAAGADGDGARIVADGLGYTNEAVLSPDGRWLYVNETIARRTVRFPARADGALGACEIVAEYPAATFPDGLAFDAEGGVWIVSVASNRVYRVPPGGLPELVLEDQDPAVAARIAAAFEAHAFGRNEIDGGRDRPLRNLASIAFGGADLRTVHLGSLQGERIATFRAPVAGAEPVHWTF